MHTLILTANSHSSSTARLKQELIRRDHQVKVYAFQSSEIRSDLSHPSELQGRPFDIIFPRLGSRGRIVADHYLSEMENQGVACLNDYQAMRSTFNKYAMHAALAKHDLPTPRTWIAKGVEGFSEVWKQNQMKPVVIKGLYGAHGNSIFLSPHPDAAQKILNLPEFVGAEFLVQEFIPETLGRSVSALVIGNRIASSIQLSALNSDNSANLSVGRVFRKAELSGDEAALILRATRSLKLDVAEVELARATHGPLLLEVNSSPGLERFESCSEKNIAQMIVEHAEHIHYSRRPNHSESDHPTNAQA